MSRRGCAVVVFARAPLPGRAKTRLATRLGEWRAARLHLRLARRALRTAARANAAALELHAAARTRHPFFVASARRFHAALRTQRGRDLGERMLHAFRLTLRRYRAAVLIGTDCPVLCARDLAAAARALAGGCDAVFAPAEDGGYALIGLRRVSPRLFEGIGWGGAEVWIETRRRIAALGWRVRTLRTLWDVDTSSDYDRLRAARVFI